MTQSKFGSKTHLVIIEKNQLLKSFLKLIRTDRSQKLVGMTFLTPQSNTAQQTIIEQQISSGQALTLQKIEDGAAILKSIGAKQAQIGLDF